jgi:hypothetical protein
LHIAFTLRREGSRVRVISARDMSARARCFWVYAGTPPPARQASGGAFDNLPGQGDPPPRPAPARGGGCANAIDSTEMQQALAKGPSMTKARKAPAKFTSEADERA